MIQGSHKVQTPLIRGINSGEYCKEWQPQLIMCVCVCVQSLNRVQIFCDLRDCSLPVSSVHGVSQTRTLERVAISFFRESSQPRDLTYISCTTGGFFTTEQPGKPTVSNTALYSLKIAKRVDHKISQLTRIHIL